MMRVTGKYGEAIVFTGNVEQEAIDQIKTILDIEKFKDAHVRIMPDVHAGAGCVIGTTMHIKDAVIPNLVGVDIGCGMLAAKLNVKEIDFMKLDNVIRNHVPSGFEKRETQHVFCDDFRVRLNDLRCKEHVNVLRGKLSIGTLGGGNHFIEVNRGSDGYLWLVVHSGSRNIGFQVAKYYQEQAYKELQEQYKKDRDYIVANAEKSQISRLLQEQKESQLPKELSYCTGTLFDDYLHDMDIMQDYAVVNRLAMMQSILSNMENVDVVESFTTIHNYIDMDKMILRKGAVSAIDGEKLVIPLNMRDGSLICIGKGNPDWNFSAPHGAGRLMSRRQARETLKLDEYIYEMADVWSTSVGNETIDECPLAYKPMGDIVSNIHDTVEIVERIIPVYNFKAK